MEFTELKTCFHYYFSPLKHEVERVKMLLHIMTRKDFGTKGYVLEAMGLCDGISRVNFWPEHSVTVWMNWDPRPTWEEARAVRAVLKTVLPVGIRGRVMAVPVKAPPHPITLWDRYQCDIDRVVVCGE